MTAEILIVVPTYGKFAFADRAIRSALENTRRLVPRVLVVDDASPDFNQKWIDALRAQYFGALDWRCYQDNGGLTRSWNAGLRLARVRAVEYACVTNSDVIFSPGWDEPVIAALESFDLVGPVTNAPGNQPRQDVRLALGAPELDDLLDDEGIDLVANHLNQLDPATAPADAINGFCMVARTKTWWDHTHDGEHVFRPRNDFNSRGQPNPTPLMTLNDDELCGRWRRAGLKIGIARRSYVFHYRSITRGDRYRSPGAYRPGS